MKLLWLKEIIGDAYTEDMDAAACQAIGKDFVARADFNAKNTRVKELEAQVGQLQRLVTELDPEAFLIMQKAHQILGEGFGRYSDNSL